MLKELFGVGTQIAMLRGGLEEASATHRAIARHVAGALDASTSTEFASALQEKTAQQKLSEVDLERDMASLADTQLRYEADAKLLQGAYAQLRAAIGDRG